MKSSFTIWIAVLLIFFGKESCAQYNYKQIDSLFNVARRESDRKTDFKTIAVAYNASKKINYATGVIKALVIYSDSYYNAGKYDYAFKYITEAENSSSSINDPILIAKMKLLKGLCYSRLGFYKEADQTLSSTISIVNRIINVEDRDYYLMTVYTDLAVNYDRMGNKNAKKLWGERSYAESELLQNSSKYMSFAAITASNKANRFTLNKQYDSAELYVKKSLVLANKCIDEYKYNKDYALWVTGYHAGIFYYTKKQYSLSALYYKNALKEAALVKYIYGIRDAYAGLAKTYTALKKPGEALQYLERSNQLTDSMGRADKAAIRTPLNYIINDKEQELKTNRNKYLQIISVIIILLLIVLSAVFFYRHRLRKEIKLSAEKMDELIRKIELSKENQSPSKIEELKEVVQLAVSNDPAFFIKFKEFDKEFNKKLLNLAPGFIAAELEFCALLRLNFETKEIARYTKVSVRAVEARKYRIRKKLGIPSDQDINLWMSMV